MNSRRRVVIGTRGSKLALIQAQIADDALTAADSSIEVELRIIKPQGDRDKSSPVPLDTIGKGWFSQEIEQELLDGTIDIAVHSLKDMLVEVPTGLTIGAYLPREDARDALVTKHDQQFESLREGAIIGTDSARRQVQMLAIKPDAVMKSVRGNVPNRVEKLTTEDYDAVILAVAGLKRLDMQHRIIKYFEVDEMTPAPGQGTIAIESRADDVELLALLEKVNDRDASRASEIERSFSDLMGGGCKAPTGAYAYRDGDTWHLIGMVSRDDGTIIRERISAPDDTYRTMGKGLAQRILDMRDHA